MADHDHSCSDEISRIAQGLTAPIVRALDELGVNLTAEHAISHIAQGLCVVASGLLLMHGLNPAAFFRGMADLCDKNSDKAPAAAEQGGAN